MILKDKIAIVTGAGRGIGKAIALEFANEGADVVITYNKNKDKAEGVRKEVEAFGRRSLAIKCDVRNAKEVEEMVGKAKKEFGRIDILVNNAGVMIKGDFQEMDDKIINETLDTNVKGIIHCTQNVLPIMKKQKYGKIVNLSSFVAFKNNTSSPIYAASKAAVVSLTRTLSREVAEDGITVNSVAPGPVDTEMVPRERMKYFIENTPMKRIARPEEIAKAVKFFASDDSAFVTGETLVVSGGMM